MSPSFFVIANCCVRSAATGSRGNRYRVRHIARMFKYYLVCSSRTSDVWEQSRVEAVTGMTRGRPRRGRENKIKPSPSTRRDGRGIPTESLLCRSDEQAFAAVVILRICNARMLYTLYACGADEENKINAFRTIHGSQYDKLVCLVRPGINVICYAPHIIATTATAAATYPRCGLCEFSSLVYYCIAWRIMHGARALLLL